MVDSTSAAAPPRAAEDSGRVPLAPEPGRSLLPAAIAALLVLLATPATAQELDRPTMWLVAAGDVLALGELTASEACIQQGTCTEVNGVIGDGTNPAATARRALLKGTGQAISTWAILTLSKTDSPRRQWAARACGLAKIAFNGYLMRRALDYQGDGRHPTP